MPVPIGIEFSARAIKENFPRVPRRKWIPPEQAQPKLPILEGELGRQNHFAIVVVKDGDLMMLDMARAKPDVIAPTDERVHLQKKLVPERRLERCLVDEFVHRD